ncbi:MAG: DUF4097 family beta strand repeat-containing protein [Bacilli bacterium]|nr:DUF4097 family beta strand repeat-containing protein [Bacilli bacterium]
MSNIQKGIKLFAICLAVFIISSIISGILFVLSIITNTSHFSSEFYFQQTFYNIKNIDVDLSTTKLEIKKGAEFKIDGNTTNPTFKMESNEDTLKIFESPKKIMNNNKTGKVTLYVLENYPLDSLYINNEAGSVKLSSISSNSFSLSQGIGITKINDSNLKNANINGSVGKIDIKNSLLNNLHLESGIGEVFIQSDITGNSYIKSGIGKVVLNLKDENDYTINVTKGIGMISINNINQSNNKVYGSGLNNLNIEGGIGKIDIKFNN